MNFPCFLLAQILFTLHICSDVEPNLFKYFVTFLYEGNLKGIPRTEKSRTFIAGRNPCHRNEKTMSKSQGNIIKENSVLGCSMSRNYHEQFLKNQKRTPINCIFIYWMYTCILYHATFFMMVVHPPVFCNI